MKIERIRINGVELEIQPTSSRYRKERVRIGATYRRSLSGKLLSRWRAEKWRWELSSYLFSDTARVLSLLASIEAVRFVDIDGNEYLVGVVSDLPLDMYTEYTLTLEEV